MADGGKTVAATVTHLSLNDDHNLAGAAPYGGAGRRKAGDIAELRGEGIPIPKAAKVGTNDKAFLPLAIAWLRLDAQPWRVDDSPVRSPSYLFGMQKALTYGGWLA